MRKPHDRKWVNLEDYAKSSRSPSVATVYHILNVTDDVQPEISQNPPHATG